MCVSVSACDSPPKRALPSCPQELGNYMRMARLHNTLPALLLVFVGAWAGTGRDPAFLTKPIVWLMAMISAGE